MGSTPFHHLLDLRTDRLGPCTIPAIAPHPTASQPRSGHQQFSWRAIVWLFAPAMLTACAGGDSPIDPLLTESINWYTGTGGSVDNERAKALLVEAAADEDPISRMWIARVYSRGRMNFRQDTAAAQAVAVDVMDRIDQLADRGVTEAIFLMGTAHAEGLAQPVDHEEAARWYQRAADSGHVLAQHNLGNVYFSGSGVPQDDTLAVRWWREAALAGDAVPQLRLGQMYEDGRGVSRDLAEAARWYEASAQRGNREAADRLAALRNRPDG